MQHRKSSLFLILAALLIVLLQLALQCNTVETARKNPTLGMQFADPITEEQLTAAITYQQSDANAEGITASFWGSQQAAAYTDSGRKAEDTTCIGYAGSAADCLPAEYSQGAVPGAVGQQCAVSTALAWALFGSNDIVGQTVTLDRTDYVISGVFTSDTCTLLYPAKAALPMQNCAAFRSMPPRRTPCNGPLPPACRPRRPLITVPKRSGWPVYFVTCLLYW